MAFRLHFGSAQFMCFVEIVHRCISFVLFNTSFAKVTASAFLVGSSLLYNNERDCRIALAGRVAFVWIRGANL